MHKGFALQHEADKTINQPAYEDVSTIFNSVFDVQLAMCPETIDEVFAVRYQVYCIDRPFEDPNCFADKREHDAYDPRSAHALIRHRITGDSVAAVRLVMAGDNPEQADFPMEGPCLPGWACMHRKHLPALAERTLLKYPGWRSAGSSGGGSMRTSQPQVSVISPVTAMLKMANAPCPISAWGFFSHPPDVGQTWHNSLDGRHGARTAAPLETVWGGI